MIPEKDMAGYITLPYLFPEASSFMRSRKMGSRFTEARDGDRCALIRVLSRLAEVW